MNIIVDTLEIACLYLVKLSIMYNMYKFSKCILHTSDYFIQLSAVKVSVSCVELNDVASCLVVCCVVLCVGGVTA